MGLGAHIQCGEAGNGGLAVLGCFRRRGPVAIAALLMVSPSTMGLHDLANRATGSLPDGYGLDSGYRALARAETVSRAERVDRVVQDERIRESSGLAHSTYPRNILFTHNDSGDSPRIFALDPAGRTRAVLTLSGAAARDWEDIAAGPEHSIWIGDIGDNGRARRDIRIYRITEPSRLVSQEVQWTRYRFAYPDGAHDAEALLVHPHSGRLYVVTKSRDDAGVYRADKQLSTDGVNGLTRIASAPALVTGGAFSPDGTRLVLRGHNWAYVYESIGGDAQSIKLPEQRQGESVDFNRPGSVLLVGSEGLRSPVHRIAVGTGQAETTTWKPRRPRVPDNGTVRPERFGAVGDGKRDDSVALQRAIDRAARVGAKVVLSEERTYLSTRRLDLPSGSYVLGSGRRSVLKFDWRVNDSQHDGYYIGNRDQLTGNTDITLHNFAIVGAATGLPAGPSDVRRHPRVPGVRLRLVNRFQLSRLRVSYVPGISIIYQGAANGMVRDNVIHHSGRDGINSTWHKRNLHHIVVKRNRISKIGDDGIAVIGAPGNTPNTKVLPYKIAIRDNKVRGWPKNPNGQLLGRGLVVLAATDVELSGNVVDRTHSYGILVAPSTRQFSTDPATGEPWRSSDIEITENRILNAGQNYPGSDPNISEPGHDAIILKRSDRVRLKGNFVENPYGRVLAMYDCRDCVTD